LGLMLMLLRKPNSNSNGTARYRRPFCTATATPTATARPATAGRSVQQQQPQPQRHGPLPQAVLYSNIYSNTNRNGTARYRRPFCNNRAHPCRYQPASEEAELQSIRLSLKVES